MAPASSVAVLILRLLTFLCLLVSLIVLAVDSVATVDVKIHFNDVYAYRYMLSTIVFGFVYTLLQIPFAVYYVSTGKRLIDTDDILLFNFYGDKVISYFLATGVGAAFGATIDLKKRIGEISKSVELVLFSNLDSFSKLDDFFTKGNVSASLLLISFLSTEVLSVLSSLALSKK